MPYLICFILSILLLMSAIAWDENPSKNVLVLIIITAIGDGGYYALSTAQTLDKAILANCIVYVIGIFAPLFMFLNVCEICCIKFSSRLKLIMYVVQMTMYLCVLGVGKNTLFYKTVQISYGPVGAYLTKTYGPVHTCYIISLVGYLAASVVVAFLLGRDKSRVSFKNLDFMIIVFFLIGSSYMVERLIKLNVELMPFIYTLGIIGILVPVIRISRYSVEKNYDILSSGLRSAGYIVFTNKLLYMGSSDYAKALFPELSEWELEKKLSGRGGRFNTYIRAPFMKYVESKSEKSERIKVFTMSDKNYICEFFRLALASSKLSVPTISAFVQAI